MRYCSVFVLFTYFCRLRVYLSNSWFQQVTIHIRFIYGLFTDTETSITVGGISVVCSFKLLN